MFQHLQSSTRAVLFPLPLKMGSCAT
jgi:hypothetical protein